MPTAIIIRVQVLPLILVQDDWSSPIPGRSIRSVSLVQSLYSQSPLYDENDLALSIIDQVCESTGINFTYVYVDEFLRFIHTSH